MNWGRGWVSGRAPVLVCYLLLASIYLLYLPHVQFVIDDWYMFPHFEQARAQGPRAEWKLAGFLAANGLWGTFRTHWLSLISVFGLYQVAGLHPRFYFLFGICLQAVAGYLLYRALARLALDRRVAFLAGALFVALPTARNPLFWFPSCGQYVLAAFWFLLYLGSVAGTVERGKVLPRAAVVQALTLMAALFSTDQSVGLVLFAALWLALLWRSRAGLASAALAWGVAAAAFGFYARFVNRAPLSGSVADRFAFSGAQVRQHLRLIEEQYRNLLGAGGGYYRVAAIGWGALAAAAAGAVIFWWLGREGGAERAGSARALLFGAGLWAMAYGPAWFLQWGALRYDYLPSLGLAVALAAGCWAALGRWPRLARAAAASLVAYSAATAFAEIQQCWTPQSKNLESIQRQLRGLNDVRYHDVIAISGTPMEIGTAQHFAMLLPYCSTPFAETVTGVWGLVVGREIYCESGRLALQHTSFMRPLQPEEIRRTHVVACGADLNCNIRTLLACEVRPGAYELHPLKDYTGSPAIAPRLYSHEELRSLGEAVYVARRHGQ